MSLYTRVLGQTAPHIPVHSFMAALGEFERGKISRATVISLFAINAADEADLDALTARIVPPPESLSLGGRILMTNVGTSYQILATCYIECFGITSFDWLVGCNRNGAAGTVSWQLFDVTNGNEIDVIDDTTGAGDKALPKTKTFGAPLGKQVRQIALRVKSTTATDDPIHLGSSVIIRRVDRMSALELHEVLLLADAGLAYTSEAALRTRLGT